MCATKLAWGGHDVVSTMFSVQKKVLDGESSDF